MSRPPGSSCSSSVRLPPWACGTCTFAGNPGLYLACQICGSERSLPAARAGSSCETASAAPAGDSDEPFGGEVGIDGSPRSSNGHRPTAAATLADKLADKPARRTEESSESMASTSRAGLDPGSQEPDFDDDDSVVLVAAPAATGDKENNSDEQADRLPPRQVVPINNLSDRQYCCVWSVEVHEDGYRPDVARTMLAAVARHVNPVLRERGWRVKRLIESTSRSWVGCCFGNGRDDADAASVNIMLNLRTAPDRNCREFRPFSRVLGVMLHEITHTSIGLEDIHPPAFYELLSEIRKQYRHLLAAGAVAKELDSYGCNSSVVVGGKPQRIDAAALQVDREQKLGLARALQPPLSGSGYAATAAVSLELEETDEGNCGASKRRRFGGRRKRPLGTQRKTAGGDGQKRRKQPPLRKGAKMVDLRTKKGKNARETKETSTARELAARAALRRLGQAGPQAESLEALACGPRVGRSHSNDGTGATEDDNNDDDSDDDDDHASDSDEEGIVPHSIQCSCRACRWDKALCRETER
jgi:WLM domain